jgi:hypothetical protein
VTKETIIDFLQKNREAFLNKYQISNIALFGSYARGENRQDSDVDIAIETPLSDYFKLYDFKEELEKYFNRKVDIVRLRDRMNESLRKRIINEGIYVR